MAPAIKDQCSLPLVLGGLGLRSATRTRQSAFWGSWADALHMIHQRHPEVADRIVAGLSHPEGLPNLSGAAEAANCLRGVEDFEPPSWDELKLGARPQQFHEWDDHEPGGVRGWQHEASSRVERRRRTREVFPVVTDAERALIRAQSGPGGGTSFSTFPSCFLTRIDSHLFRVLLLRRLQLPLSLAPRLCRCGRPLDPCGHHRAACAVSGVLGRRGFAVESAAARICREGGARVTTNRMIRDMDLGVPITDGRRVEVVADGLHLFGGVQLAIDTTLVSTLHCDGSPRRGAAHTDGVTLVAARRRKERTYPEFVGPRSRARLVVLAGEVGGRWSPETRSFLSKLAKAKARSEPPILQRRAEQAWRMRWSAILACAAARAFASSLLDLKLGGGADGLTPLCHEVLASWHHVPVGM